MKEKNYSEIFEGKFKSLGIFADDLNRAMNPQKFFYIIVKNIVPLVCESQNFVSIYQQMAIKKKEYCNEVNKLHNVIPQEIESIFRRITCDLESKKLDTDRIVQNQIEEIQFIFDNKQQYCIPAYTDCVYEKLKFLMTHLLDTGNEDIVHSYAELEHNADAKEEQKAQSRGPYIRKFRLVPSLEQLHELQRKIDRDAMEELWIIWEHLLMVEWCWNTPKSFFEDEKLEYSDYNAQITSTRLFELHSLWFEMLQIKNNDATHKAIYFTKERYKEYIELLCDKIFLSQSINLQFSTVAKKSRLEFPSQLSLRIDSKTEWLLLDVRWNDSNISKSYVIRKRLQQGAPLSVITSLLNNPIGTPCSISKIDVSGTSVPHVLTRLKLKGPLQKLFFATLPNSCIVMKCNPVTKDVIDELSDGDKSDLSSYIKSLSEYPPFT